MTRVTPAHIEARRAAIRDAAFRLFVRKGVEGARMEEIAAEAGLSAGAIYRYYPSKEHLLLAVLSFCIEQDRALFDLEERPNGSPLGLLLAKGRMIWGQIGTAAARDQTILSMESALAAARHGGSVAAERRRLWEGTIAFTETLVRRAQEAGEIDPAIDARALMLLLLASWIGTDILALDLGADLDPQASFNMIAQIFERLAPSNTAASPGGVTEASPHSSPHVDVDAAKEDQT